MRVELEYVHYMPKQLVAGVLYVSREYKTAAHLCPCGCGNKIRTPLTPTEWNLTVSNLRPSLTPSVGNWQLACRSHYWIKDGEIIWSNQWADEKILRGRRGEDARRQAYYREEPASQFGLITQIWNWIKKLFVG